MSATTEEQLKPLRDAISEKPPFCSGVISPPADAFTLFYKTNGAASWLDLSNASELQLQQLAQACKPATFGVNSEDVFDENYRKASKLDTADFATKFDLHQSDLVKIIHSGLLEGHEATKTIGAELYKLNVYGKDSFFKAHKDTPRGESMFGSLVLVFPTPHDGGALVLRHGGKEWTFDSAKSVSTLPKPSIRYIAFFSDVEHEVALVTSGYRVTLTYNLYFGTAQPLDPIINVGSNEIPFKNALSTLLQNDEFMPQGGTLGFGLKHQYPIDPTKGKGDGVSKLLECLKGSDAVIRRVCGDLSLDAHVKVMYRDEYDPDPIMLDRIVDLSTWGEIDRGVSYHLRSQPWNGVRVKSFGLPAGHKLMQYPYEEQYKDWVENPQPEENVWWVTQLTEFTTAKTEYIKYGNEASLAYLYGNFCLIVRVGAAGSRGMI